MPKDNEKLPEWENVLSQAAHLQRLLPDAVLVGGTATAAHVQHRFSRDADHILTDLRLRFDDVLAHLESVAGWKTARIKRPVLILGSLNGIETGIRQLIRDEPLEVVKLNFGNIVISVPTMAEILRIKGVLILKRNATRDYLDFAALASAMQDQELRDALSRFDELYPQASGESPSQQLQAQLSNPLPDDLEEVNLAEYKNLNPHWQQWGNVCAACERVALDIFEHIANPSASPRP